jgi:hypothetical protein
MDDDSPDDRAESSPSGAVRVDSAPEDSLSSGAVAEGDPDKCARSGFDLLAAAERDAERGRQVFAAACPRLAELGAATVRVAYDGYGDSGCVEGVDAFREDQQSVDLPADLDQALVDAAELLLPCGWENDQGAYGELVLDVARRTIVREHAWRIETVDRDEETWTL